MGMKYKLPDLFKCPRCRVIPVITEQLYTSMWGFKDVSLSCCGITTTTSGGYSNSSRRLIKSWNTKVEDYLEQQIVMCVLTDKEISKISVKTLLNIRLSHGPKHRKHFSETLGG